MTVLEKRAWGPYTFNLFPPEKDNNISRACRDGETYWNNEGCLSVPNLRGDLHRATEATVTALDRSGHRVVHRFRGLTAGTAQHELDHLDGRLFVDRVEDTTTLATWREFELNQRERFVEHIRQVVKETT